MSALLEPAPREEAGVRFHGELSSLADVAERGYLALRHTGIVTVSLWMEYSGGNVEEYATWDASEKDRRRYGKPTRITACAYTKRRNEGVRIDWRPDGWVSLLAYGADVQPAKRAISAVRHALASDQVTMARVYLDVQRARLSPHAAGNPQAANSPLLRSVPRWACRHRRGPRRHHSHRRHPRNP
jgi:hypothetical protein